MGTVPAWSPPIEVAGGNGHRGPWRGNNSEYDFVDDAAVAVNDQGFNGSQQGLLAAKFSASPAGRLAMANSLFISGESSRILFVTAPPPAVPSKR